MKPVTLQDYKRRMLRVLVYIQDHLDDALRLNDPQSTEPNELLTDIHAPLASRNHRAQRRHAK